MTIAAASPASFATPLPWRYRHTIALIAITAACLSLGTWRPLSLYASWTSVMALLAAFVLIAGHGIKGVWRGALIDNRNKVSLSRLQMLSWTILVVSAIGVLGIARALENPTTGLDLAVPPTVWLLMGISLTSLIGSPLMKNAKVGQTQLHLRMATNPQPGDARWSDLFLGEEQSTSSYLDISKVQMFLFTVLLILAYGVAIAAQIRAGVLPDSLPVIGEGMLALLGLSHAGYLVGKATPPAKQE